MIETYSSWHREGVTLELYIVYLLLNIMILLTSVLLFHLFWVRHGRFHKTLSAFVFLAAALIPVIVCVTFAVQTYPGYRFDLRHVSLIFSTLIGGPVAGGIVWIGTSLYRFLLGGSGVWPGFVGSSFLYITLLVMYRPFREAGPRRKMKLAVIASALFPASWAPFFLLDVPDPLYYVWHIVLYQLCSTAGTLLILYLIETLKSQVYLQEEFVNMEKFQLIGEMAASISHEIRNPLTSTRGFLQLLKSDSHTEADRALYLDIAINGIDQANLVLTDYLTFAKPSIDKVQVLQVNEEVFSTLSLITPLATFSNVMVSYERLEGDIHIFGEKQKFNQCLLNIMKNCIEAMPSGGTLSILVKRQETTAQIIVEDTGAGMTTEQLKRLGSPFYSTKDKGTGLGMMVVFSIVKAMNGTIAITSTPGQGSRFCLSFPITHT